MSQAVGHSPLIDGVPSSHFGPFMLVSWWTIESLGRFFSGFHPATNFNEPFLHTHLINFILSSPAMVRQSWSASILVIHTFNNGALVRSSSTRPRVGHKLRLLRQYLFTRKIMKNNYSNLSEDFTDSHSKMLAFSVLTLSSYEFLHSSIGRK